MKKGMIHGKQARFAGITVALTVLIVTVTVLVNAVFGMLVSRYGLYSRMTSNPTFEVTEDCYDYLDRVLEKAGGETTPRVDIIFCDLPENLEKEITQTMLYETACSLQEHYPDVITLSCYDIWTNPNTVRKYAEQVNLQTGEMAPVTIDSECVIIASEGYHRVYALEEFFSFKDGDTDQLWAYNGEKKLAAGIMRAVSKNRPIACLTNNHGETYYDFELVYLLDDAGYDVMYLDLYHDPIPEDCSLIVTYNPTADLVRDSVSAVSETARLEEFLAQEGNNFLIFLGNSSPTLPNFEAFLAEWGAELQYDTASDTSYRYMVQDTAQSLTSDGYTIYAQAQENVRTDELLAGALARRVVFKNATSLRAAQGFVNNGDGSFTKGDRVLYSIYEGGSSATHWANGRAVSSADGAILMSLTEQKIGQGVSTVGVVSSVDSSTGEFLQSAVYGNTDALMALCDAFGCDMVPETLSTKPFESPAISTVTTREMLYWTVGLTGAPLLLIGAVAAVVLIRRRRA